ncbi:hypothetical protein LSTR_LSTR010867 [Laodelphax striatellus]|uniref:Uncharacterized protein n=1 Tax=Laodelphax striatellus TaxID=195883 RepID=A0A482WN80_LAOST|nr:hypothetical protein LSTR_LSTR010867 [Laodelphax striatellus]
MQVVSLVAASQVWNSFGWFVAGAGLGAAVVVFFNSTTLRLFSSLALFAGVAVGEALVRLVALPAVDTFCLVV